MAPTPTGDPAVPPLIREAVRLVVPSTVPPAARRLAGLYAGRVGIPLVEVPLVGGEPATRSSQGDVLVHPVPDIFGRLSPPPSGWRILAVVDRATGHVSAYETIEYGLWAIEDLAEMSSRLHAVWKSLVQMRGVRPVLPRPAPFGMAFVAPGGIPMLEGLCVTPVSWQGLPDLVVVHDPRASAWASYDGPDEMLEQP